MELTIRNGVRAVVCDLVDKETKTNSGKFMKWMKDITYAFMTSPCEDVNGGLLLNYITCY